MNVGNYRTIVNQRLGRSFRLVLDRDFRYWTVGVTVGTGWYLRLDVGPFGLTILRQKGAHQP